MNQSRLLRPFEALVLAGLFVGAFRYPGALGGWLELALAFLLPIFLLESVLRGRSLLWTGLALGLGLAVLYQWVPRTLAVKGGLPSVVALVATGLLCAWEAAGWVVVAALTRWAHGRGGTLAAAGAAGLGALAWELGAFHVYPWSWGSAYGALPWTARAAAFLGTYGLSACTWAMAAAVAAGLVTGQRPRRILLAPALWLSLLLLLPLAWRLLPRGAWRQVDIALLQPNWEPGVRFTGMEAELWHRTDRLLAQHHLPRPDRPTLVLWPESAVLGLNHLLPDARLASEAQRRNVAWLFGTEGGAQGGAYLTYNLVRGEVDGRPAFLQAKTEPMAFGERMPGPAWLRTRLDAALDFASQEPGTLSAASAFRVPTPQGELGVHPLLCSEALLPLRARDGIGLTGAELLSNHTNDGWFERSIATDLHAAQIRLRAPELGLPLVRVTSTGKSGLFREDGTGNLWGEPLTSDARAFALAWQPIQTPARSPWLLRGLASAFLALLLTGLRPSRSAAHEP